MGVSQSLSHIFAPLVDFVYPPRCPLCGEGLAAQDGLCARCWSGLEMPGEPSCSLCQRPFSSEMPDGAICASCLAEPPEHDGVTAATIYNDTSRQLVLSFKHGRKIAMARMMARLINARLDRVTSEWIVVPVPLHRGRLWRRSFNQSALLAREIASATGATLALDCLVRRKATPPLGGLRRKERIRALSGAIAVPDKARKKLKGRSVVLADDVLTSGATTNACVKALKQAGAERVLIACFARVIAEGS